MIRNVSNNILAMGIVPLIVAGSTAQVKKEILFKDTFDGKGALGSGWEIWKNVSSVADSKQSGGSLVFGRSSSTWVQAASRPPNLWISIPVNP